MSLSREEILDVKSNINDLCGLACDLGYKDPLRQLINSNGSCVGDLLYMISDNPGLCEVMIEWLADTYGGEEEYCEECGESLCFGECMHSEEQESERVI